MLPERRLALRPDRMIVVIEGEEELGVTEDLANRAVEYAQDMLPKISGRLAGSLLPTYSTNHWGIYFPDQRAWFLEHGTNPFTMRSLAGKTIPMWVDDPDGEVAKAEGRKAQTRVTVDGRKQTKIFRRAARIGQRKWVRRGGRLVSVPASYPGAPGRISSRMTNGQIAPGNVGVRWRHPGIGPRAYLNQAIEQAAADYAEDVEYVTLVDSATYSIATRR